MAKKSKEKRQTSKVYFATEPTKKIGGLLEERVEQYFEFCHRTGRLDLWFRVFYIYNTAYIQNGELQTGGQYGEYTVATVNHLKNIILHLHNNATSERISFEPHATNTDTKSQAQTLLATGLLEYYLRDKKLERNIKEADMDALLYGEGFVGLDWDANIGDETEDENGEPTREGDIVYTNFTPNNVIRDVTKQSYEKGDWVITREFVNKYDMAEKYPEYRDKIISIQPYKSSDYRDRLGEYEYEYINDDIPSFVFYHKKTQTVPEGRMVRYLESDMVLTDGPLPFDEIPVYREAPEELDSSPFGSTITWDLLPLQEMLDILYSIIITNQKTFGVQCIMAPKGSGLEAGQLAEGLSFIEYNETPGGGKPETLQLLATPAEVFNFVDKIERQMETISGINSVVRGNPDTNLTSGVALALVHSTSMQFAKGQSEAYHNLTQDVGTATINILKSYADTKRVAAITGRSNRQYLKEFTGEDIADISRVTVDTGNPLTATTAGKINLAEALLSNGLIQTAEEYLMVLQTGKLEPLTEGITSELMLVRTENEDLVEDKDVVAVLTDNHSLHIQEHKSVLASTDARNDPQLVEATLTHIQEHLNILKDPVNSELLMMLGQQPQQPSVQGQQDLASAVDPSAAEISAPGDVNLPNLPSLPTIPGEGRYDPSSGETVPQK